jgi:hypothetical protein
VAARTRWRPLYAVFLERVIQIEAVQRHREAATDPDYTTRHFFSEGVLPGTLDHRWSVDEPVAFPWGPIPPATPEEPVSLPMQHAWNAAAAAWKGFIAALVNGELIASGVHPATGLRSVLDPAEWTRSCLMIDVHDGDLIEGSWPRSWGVRWTAITLRAAKQPRQKKARGHGYDWEAAWTYATTLRAEDQWDWGQVGRDKNQPLPARRGTVEKKIEEWFAARGNVPNIGDIRQNITIPLYAGRRTRGKRKR